MFRHKRAIPVSCERQREIYNMSRGYQRLDGGAQTQVRWACERAGGEYAQAVLEFVTTRAGAETVCRRHFISRSTLTRAVRNYYIICDRAGVGKGGRKVEGGGPLPFDAETEGEGT